MKKVLFIIGSLRKNSFSSQAAKIAEKFLGEKVEISHLNFENLPIFSQDLENQEIEAVASARNTVAEADAVWVFSPSYNQSAPGGLKNLLEWLSRSLESGNSAGKSAIDGKITLATVTAASGHDEVNRQLKVVLEFIRTKFLGGEGVKINPEAWGSGELLLSEEDFEKVKIQAEDLLKKLA